MQKVDCRFLFVVNSSAAHAHELRQHSRRQQQEPGHTAAIEKASEMNNHEKYHVAYYYAVFYCYVITLPTGITGYHTFGSEAANHGNAFYLFDKSLKETLL
jgi:hypothetical protein